MEALKRKHLGRAGTTSPLELTQEISRFVLGFFFPFNAIFRTTDFGFQPNLFFFFFLLSFFYYIYYYILTSDLAFVYFPPILTFCLYIPTANG